MNSLESETMPLDYDFSPKLKDLISKLVKKDSRRAEIIYKKVKQIINSNEFTVEHYKNLSHKLSNLKRAHIDKSFVLTFSYDKKRKFVLFLDFGHHDSIYKK
jgi:YafQ family addiction module toxin component